jgi:hypothetical protein
VIARQILGVNNLQSATGPIVQSNGEKAVVVSAAVLYAVRLIVMGPKLTRKPLWLIIWGRAAGELGCAADAREPVTVEFDEPQLANQSERREAAYRELISRDDSYRRMPQERFHEACRRTLAEETDSKRSLGVMKSVAWRIARPRPEKWLSRRQPVDPGDGRPCGHSFDGQSRRERPGH